MWEFGGEQKHQNSPAWTRSVGVVKVLKLDTVGKMTEKRWYSAGLHNSSLVYVLSIVMIVQWIVESEAGCGIDHIHNEPWPVVECVMWD